MNIKDWQAIVNDWVKVNLEMFGTKYPFVPDNEVAHGSNDSQ